jgi:hypothetical protein
MPGKKLKYRTIPLLKKRYISSKVSALAGVGYDLFILHKVGHIYLGLTHRNSILDKIRLSAKLYNIIIFLKIENIVGVLNGSYFFLIGKDRIFIRT